MSIPRKDKGVEVTCRCPACGTFHVKSFVGKPSQKQPSIYCDLHKNFRKLSVDGTGYNARRTGGKRSAAA